jgi:hypothetical protein
MKMIQSMKGSFGIKRKATQCGIDSGDQLLSELDEHL